MSPETAAAMARVAYEARRAYARALGEVDEPSWELASAVQRLHAVAGVQAVLSGEARSGAHRYDQLGLEERRKVLLFRAVVLAMVDGPCNGFAHLSSWQNPEDHECHLDTCMSRFGVPPGLWRDPDPMTSPPEMINLYS